MGLSPNISVSPETRSSTQQNECVGLRFSWNPHLDRKSCTWTSTGDTWSAHLMGSRQCGTSIEDTPGSPLHILHVNLDVSPRSAHYVALYQRAQTEMFRHQQVLHFVLPTLASPYVSSLGHRIVPGSGSRSGSGIEFGRVGSARTCTPSMSPGNDESY